MVLESTYVDSGSPGTISRRLYAVCGRREVGGEEPKMQEGVLDESGSRSRDLEDQMFE
jgi:hypothetical protein